MTASPRETQHARTRLSWGRSCLALATVTLAEVRLAAGARIGVAIGVLATGAAVVGLTWLAAAIRSRTDASALTTRRRRSGGRTPALLAGAAMVVALAALMLVMA